LTAHVMSVPRAWWGQPATAWCHFRTIRVLPCRQGVFTGEGAILQRHILLKHFAPRRVINTMHNVQDDDDNEQIGPPNASICSDCQAIRGIYSIIKILKCTLDYIFVSCLNIVPSVYTSLCYYPEDRPPTTNIMMT